MSCSEAIASTFPACTSLADPSSPWPYSDGRAGVVAASSGMMQSNGAVAVLPGFWVGGAVGKVVVAQLAERGVADVEHPRAEAPPAHHREVPGLVQVGALDPGLVERLEDGRITLLLRLLGQGQWLAIAKQLEPARRLE